MELPDLTSVYEKLGVLGTMLFAVLWLLWHNMRHEYGKEMTPDSLSKRLGAIEESLGKLAGVDQQVAKVEAKCDARWAECEENERHLSRVLDRARDLDTWKERLILMWDKHLERTGYRHPDDGRGGRGRRDR